jgi:hypothetical protein
LLLLSLSLSLLLLLSRLLLLLLLLPLLLLHGRALATVPANWMIEDPYLWIDSKGAWHIINHAYNNHEYEQCGNSTLSAHFFR